MKKLTLVVMLLAICAVPAFANLLVNGGFEDGLTGWTAWSVPGYGASPGTMDPRLNGDIFVPGGAYSGVNYASLQIGFASALGGFYQTINVPNGDYIVSGWIAGGQQDGGGWWELKAWDGGFPGGEGDGGVIIAANAGPWTNGTQTITVTTGQLTIGSKVGQYWPGLVAGHYDDLSVTAVPEPSSILALASGLAGMAGFVIRRRK